MSILPRFFLLDYLTQTAPQPRFVEGMTSFSELAAFVALSSLSFSPGEVGFRVGPASDVLVLLYFFSIHIFPVLFLWTIPDPYMGYLEHSLQQVVLVEVIKLRRNDLLDTIAGSVADSRLLLDKTKIYGLGRL